jgi:cell division protein ZapA
MSTVDVIIRGMPYRIVCADGEEEKLSNIAGLLDERLRKMAQLLPKTSEHMLLVMTALSLVDELHELPSDQKVSIEEKNGQGTRELAVAQAIDAIAEYVETIASRIKNA